MDYVRFRGQSRRNQRLIGQSNAAKLRYGSLEVAVGGDLSGEISKYIDKDEKPAADDSVEVTDEDG